MARLSVKRKSESGNRYIGVYKENGRAGWKAVVTIDKVVHTLGFFPTEKAAALARDRVVRHYRGDDARLNFPSASGKSMSVKQARQQAKTQWKEFRRRKPVVRKAQSATGYKGVRPYLNRFQAYVTTTSGKRITLGCWLTARQAGIARDRAILFLKLPNPLNLPGASRHRGAASVQQLRREAKLTIKRKTDSGSPYIGVDWREGNSAWRAYAWIANRSCFLGLFQTAKAAALARDRVMLHHYGAAAILNFPHASPTPISAKRMHQLAKANRKQVRHRHLRA